MNTKEIIELIKNTENEMKLLEILKDKKLTIEIVKTILDKTYIGIIKGLLELNLISEEMLLKASDKLNVRAKDILISSINEEMIINILIKNESYLKDLIKDCRLNVSAETLDHLADKYEDTNILSNISRNIFISNKTLEKIFYKTNDEDVLEVVAGNKNISIELLEKIIDNSDVTNVLGAATWNENTNAEMLDKIVDNTDKIINKNGKAHIFRRVVLNKFTSAGTLDKIMEIEKNEEISFHDLLEKISEHKNVSIKTLNKIVEFSYSSEELSAVAENENCSIELLEKIIDKCHSKDVLISVVNNKNTSRELLEKIVNNTADRNVLEVVALNKNISDEMLEKIIEESSNEWFLEELSITEHINKNILEKASNKLSKMIEIKNIKNSFQILEHDSVLDFVENLIDQINDPEVLKVLAKKAQTKLENII